VAAEKLRHLPGQLRLRFPSILLSVDVDKTLIRYSAPEGIIVLVMERLDWLRLVSVLLSDTAPECIKITMASKARMAKFIGKGAGHRRVDGIKISAQGVLALKAKASGRRPGQGRHAQRGVLVFL
jgi:hypothetical protein